MITIYSTSEGKLFTDRKEHFYIDAELLMEKAIAVKTATILNRIAQALGFQSMDSLRTYTRCKGVTEEVLMDWILSGKIADALHAIA